MVVNEGLKKALRFFLTEINDCSKHLDVYPDDLGEAVNAAQAALQEHVVKDKT